MAQAILQKILNQLKELELEELQQLNQAIDKHLAVKQETANQTTFYQALLNSGLVRQIKHPSYVQTTQHKLVQVRGKPISETIVEERR
ncbi:hypothetical protein GS682_26350 [Nostoc sp. B(2019)]|nr:hypothetical protein [Nostoc sp. B(2019)]